MQGRSLRVILQSAALGVCLFAGGGGSVFAATSAPTTEDELIGTVRQALVAGDQATLESLVNWEGATPRGRRLVTYQMRFGFGRPIASVALEPLPQEGVSEMQARGVYKLNMPAPQRLRVVFDEPEDSDGHKPGVMFLIGRQGDAYRIALVVLAKPPNRN